MTTASPLRTSTPAVVPSRAALRVGAALILGGAVTEYAVTALHPHREAPNDHARAFAEYAASRGWIAVHLGQFLAGGVLLVGMIVLIGALRANGAPAPMGRVAAAATVVAGAVFAVLQAVDGVALKHAVDSLAAAPPEAHDAYFHDTEVVRWLEWGMAGYSRTTLGLAVVALGVVVATSRGLPRALAVLALVSGAGFVVDGVVVSTEGFSTNVLAGLVGWGGLAVFAVAATVAAWRRR